MTKSDTENYEELVGVARSRLEEAVAWLEGVIKVPSGMPGHNRPCNHRIEGGRHHQHDLAGEKERDD